MALRNIAIIAHVEHGKTTFDSVHVKAAERIAKLTGSNAVERLVHVSGIGADPQSGSSYICSRGQGELAVRQAFNAVTFILKPISNCSMKSRSAFSSSGC